MAKVTPGLVVALIDEMFPNRADGIPLDPPRLAGLQTIARLTAEIPGELNMLEGRDYAALFAGMAGLESEISDVRSRQERRGRQLTVVVGFEPSTPLDLIREALAKCPDVAPAIGTTQLAFIDDEMLRQDLRLDMSSALNAFVAGEWKAATVLGGSVVEALLLLGLKACQSAELKAAIGAVRERDPSFPLLDADDLESWAWGLHQYTEVASEMDIIQKRTRDGVRQLKEFRNLVHPGAAARTGQKCSKGTALSALSAVEFVVEDMEARR